MADAGNTDGDFKPAILESVSPPAWAGAYVVRRAVAHLQPWICSMANADKEPYIIPGGQTVKTALSLYQFVRSGIGGNKLHDTDYYPDREIGAPLSNTCLPASVP